MFHVERLAIALVAVSLGVTSAGTTVQAAADGAALVKDYFDLLKSGNIESASYLWTEEDQERSGRFGIEYTGIAFKGDCTSPMVLNLEEQYGRLDPAVRRTEDLKD